MSNSHKSMVDNIAKPTRRWREGDILFGENEWVMTANVVTDDPEEFGRLGLHPYGDDQICVIYITAEQAKAWDGCGETA